MDGDGPRLVYNPDDGSVELRTGGPSVTVEGIAAELQFERMTPDGDAAAALWLGPQEVEILGKIVATFLKQVDEGKLRVTDQGRATLEALQPRLTALQEQVSSAAS